MGFGEIMGYYWIDPAERYIRSMGITNANNRYWGASVCAQFTAHVQGIHLTEWDATSYSTAVPPFLRKLDSPKHYPESVVREVHADREFWAEARRRIRGALGASLANTLIRKAQVPVSSSSSFNAGANAMVTAAINLGYAATDVDAVVTILRSRGFTVTV